MILPPEFKMHLDQFIYIQILIKKQNIHMAVNQISKRSAMPIDAETVGQRYRDLAVRRVRNFGSMDEGGLCFRWVKEITLHVYDRRPAHLRVIDIRGG